MPDSNRGIAVQLDTGFYLSVLGQRAAAHVGDLRVALRSIDDGSFGGKAAASRPGTLLQFRLEPSPATDAAAIRLCNRCFVSLVGELITFLDRMIAVQRLGRRKLPVPDGATTPEGLQQFILQQLEKEYAQVATDTRLTNPKKLAEFPGIDDFAYEAALSCFELRRAIEHHGARCQRGTALRYGRLKLLAGDVEVSTPGQAAPPGVGISLGMDHVCRVLPARSDVVIGEDELEHVMFTIQRLVAPEVRRVVDEAASPRLS